MSALPPLFNPCQKFILEEIEFVAALAERYRLLTCQRVDSADSLAEQSSLASLMSRTVYWSASSLRRAYEPVKFLHDGIHLTHEARPHSMGRRSNDEHRVIGCVVVSDRYRDTAGVCCPVYCLKIAYLYIYMIVLFDVSYLIIYLHAMKR